MICTGRTAVLPLILFLLLGCGAKPSESLVIATAANMQFAMKELSTAFSQETGIHTEMVIGSSGKLTAQIREGAPFDFLVSADLKYPEALQRNGLTDDAPLVYAYGRLVLWTVDEQLVPDLELLEETRVRHIALANPNTAPYGAAAQQVLEATGLAEKVREKLVYGESIAQTNQFVISAAAEFGFTALAVVLSPAMLNQGNWAVIDPALYEPIAQGAVVLNNRPEMREAARRFRDFLQSPQAKLILQDYGYEVPK
jgi:molybdate transport system substrate-binding protein